MATQFGNIWAQWVGDHRVRNTIATHTVHPNNRTITAEAAIALLETTKNDHWSETGISQIVSNGVNETFNPPVPRINRSNVTEITFRTASSSRTRIWARYIIHYWN